MRLCRSQRKDRQSFSCNKEENMKKNRLVRCQAMLENVLALFEAVFVRCFHRILCIGRWTRYFHPVEFEPMLVHSTLKRMTT